MRKTREDFMSIGLNEPTLTVSLRLRCFVGCHENFVLCSRCRSRDYAAAASVACYVPWCYT